MKSTPKKKVVVKKRAPAKKKVAKKRAPAVKGAYTAILEANEQKFVGKGATAFDAMLALEVPTFLLKTKATLFLSTKEMQSSQMFLALQLRRFRNGRVARAMWAKRLEGRLK